MTCKECVHEKVCKNAYLFKVTPPNVCGFFQNKADFVEVCRCEKCKYWQDNNGGYPHDECRWGKDETPDADDFCSFGERKENK